MPKRCPAMSLWIFTAIVLAAAPAAAQDRAGLVWNTFLGGPETHVGGGIAVDGRGNVYVVGTSAAPWGHPVRPYTAGMDAFVAKLDASGALVWNTFLGGPGGDYGKAIAVDRNGNVYVTGTSMGHEALAVNEGGQLYVQQTSGATWGGRPVRAYTTGRDAFVARLDATTGALVWNTFLGGSGADEGHGIAVDGDRNVYVVGTSNAAWGGSPMRTHTAGKDAFAAKLDAASGVLVWNTFLGGSGSDEGWGIAVDGSGNLYVAGTSDAVWGGPVRPYVAGTDAFAARLNAASGALVWNTFLGSSGKYSSTRIAVDGSGQVAVAGTSDGTWGTPVRAYTAGDDAFAAKLEAASGALVWNTFLGGSGRTDQGLAIAVDGSGDVYLTGSSDAAWGNPTRGFAGGDDAFAAKLNPSGALVWNTFLGGTGHAIGFGIAVDRGGSVYVSGVSSATWGNPVRAYKASAPFKEGEDAFAAKLDPASGARLPAAH